jgi:hypothetical protein
VSTAYSKAAPMHSCTELLNSAAAGRASSRDVAIRIFNLEADDTNIFCGLPHFLQETNGIVPEILYFSIFIHYFITLYI